MMMLRQLFLLEGNWGPRCLPAWKGRLLSLALLIENWLMWEFPVVVEHEDGWSNKKGFWKLPQPTFSNFPYIFKDLPESLLFTQQIVLECLFCAKHLFKVLEINISLNKTDQKIKIRKNVCPHGAYLLMFQRPSLPVPGPILLMRKVLKLRSDVVLL